MDDLPQKLETAALGSAGLSAEALMVLTGERHEAEHGLVVKRFDPVKQYTNDRGSLVTVFSEAADSITESIDAAWAMAEARGLHVSIQWMIDPVGYECVLDEIMECEVWRATAKTPALSITAALVRAQMAGGSDERA